MGIKSDTDLNQFTSVGTVNLRSDGTGPTNNVVTGVLNFPDGTRSSAAVRRVSWPLPANWPAAGWRPVLTTDGGGTWSPLLPPDHSNQTAENFDQLMGQGYVMYFLSGNLGNNGQANNKQWPGGWWAHPLKGVAPEQLAWYRVGTQKLASQTVQASNAVMGQQGQPPLPMPTPMPMAVVPVAPVPVRFWTLPKLLIAGAVVGGLYYALE